MAENYTRALLERFVAAQTLKEKEEIFAHLQYIKRHFPNIYLKAHKLSPTKKIAVDNALHEHGIRTRWMRNGVKNIKTRGTNKVHYNKIPNIIRPKRHSPTIHQKSARHKNHHKISPNPPKSGRPWRKALLAASILAAASAVGLKHVPAIAAPVPRASNVQFMESHLHALKFKHNPAGYAGTKPEVFF
jgi:hypothetical protein